MRLKEDFSRIRWSNDERRLLARRMVEISNTPQGARLSNLKLLAQAQEILPLDRRREVTSWAPLRSSFEPILEEYRNSPFFGAPPPITFEEDEPAEEELETVLFHQNGSVNNGTSGQHAELAIPAFAGPAINGLAAPPRVPQAGETPAESALLQALESPRVLAALTQLFQTAIGQALLAGLPQQADGTSAATSVDASSAGNTTIKLRAKVLVAGLDTVEAERLTQAMGSELDLRFWRQSENREQLRQTAKPCSVAVLMPNATEPGIEAILKSLKLTLVRHTRGGTEELISRLKEMREHGLFNLLT